MPRQAAVRRIINPIAVVAEASGNTRNTLERATMLPIAGPIMNPAMIGMVDIDMMRPRISLGTDSANMLKATANVAVVRLWAITQSEINSM